MHIDFKTIAVRALNSCRTLHAPSYLGLRLFLKSLADTKDSSWGESFVHRKLAIRDTWRFYSYQVFKRKAENGEKICRTFLAASPVTMLAEAAVLGFLSSETAFQLHVCAYNHLWPKSKRAGRNHTYYLEGYKTRNQNVSQLLKKDPHKVAFVTDIKGFYPNVSVDKLVTRLDRRLDGVANKTYANAVSNLAASAVSSNTVSRFLKNS